MQELDNIQKFIESEQSENAKDYLIFPLFKKIFESKDFKKQTEASGADLYIEGKLIVELKDKYDDWCSGFFQAAHYQKKGLTFSTICVISYHFVALWKLKDLPKEIHSIISKSDSQIAPNEIGKINSKKLSKAQKNLLLQSATFTIDEYNYGMFNDIKVLLLEFLDYLKNLDSTKLQINPQNFIHIIESMENYFDNPMDAIHCFYAIVNFWDTTSVVAEARENAPNQVWVSCQNGRKNSETIIINPKKQFEFRKFVESHYVFTHHEEGLTTDYYFSRFDEVISKLNPEYTKQHGIFFTDINLSKFALWFVHHFYETKLSKKYIIFDPAAGSGNLVTSWRRNHLKHKIVSELQPDLLKIIERRMKNDEIHLETGFTVIPKTIENKGLNFLDKSAKDYLAEIQSALKEKNLKIDKPFAFLLNPPYKNTDENEGVRIETKAEYGIDKSIIAISGEDAGKERYLAFLTQIINISKIQVAEDPTFKPIIMIFTPTSWLIPRPTYKDFRKIFDSYFKYETGFIITSNEFFKLQGTFPIAFTIWSYNESANDNKIKLRDYTHFTAKMLNLNWNQSIENLNSDISKLLRATKTITFSTDKETIQENLKQTMYDFKRDPTKQELDSKEIFGGLPLKDERRKNKKTYGISNSKYIGFMDDCTPVRIRPKQDDRFDNKSNLDTVWFRLDAPFKDMNKIKCLNGPSDNRSYCAYDLETAKKTFTWFSLAKAFNGNYPIWANQMDIWIPNITKDYEKHFYSLCFAFVLAESRAVITKFEKDNPIQGAPEIFVDNPFSPNNPDSFWMKILDKHISKDVINAINLVNEIKELYKIWNVDYCKDQILKNVGLQDEPYFKYFDYPDFVNKNSGLIQIKKYAEINGKNDLTQKFLKITELSKIVKEEIYSILVDKFKYFE